MRGMGKLRAGQIVKLTKPGRYSDGLGLHVFVSKTGARAWVQRITIRGVRRDLGLGPVAAVSLSQARDQAYANWLIARKGGDPRTERRAAALTFAEAAQATLDANRERWAASVCRYWLRPLELYCGLIWDLAVDQIGRGDVLACLLAGPAVWTSKPAEGRKVRRQIRAVLAWCLAHDHVERNVAENGQIDAALPAQPAGEHHAAVAWADAPAVYRSIGESRGEPAPVDALRFLVLTAARSAEVRGAEWTEIDETARTWTIPAGRSKTKRDHVIPLSAPALAILGDRPRGRYVFAGRTGRPLSDMAWARTMAAVAPGATVHGWRSTFSTWANEATTAAPDVIDRCLGHVVGSGVERCYNRAAQVEKRRGLMAQWAAYVTTGLPTG